MTQFPVQSVSQDLYDVLKSRLPSELVDVLHEEAKKASSISVACSGGADSVCALWLMHTWAKNYGVRLQVLHFNHGLRGEHSDSDEAFVKALAAHLGWPFFCEKAGSLEKKSASETALRKLRHVFFKKIIEETQSRVMVFGHHLDDVAETFVMRWLRGSGARGLSAPRPVQIHLKGIVHVRPLLNLKKSEIEVELFRNGIPWRVDASNASDDYLRNRVRNHVIPVLENMSAHPFYDGVMRTRSLLEEEDAALEAIVDSFWPQLSPEKSTEAYWNKALVWPKGIVRRLLWRYLTKVKVMLNSSAFDRLLEAIMDQQSVQMSVANGFLRLEKNHLKLVNREPLPQFDEVLSEPDGKIIFSDGSSLVSIRTKVDDLKLNNNSSCWIPFSIGLPLQVRSWRASDGYLPLGSPGFKKLQDQFVDRKIPKADRGRLPVIVDAAGDVLWAPGLVPSEKTRLRSGEVEAFKLIWSGCKI
jgi:tRNA(Ile)-lysidine synthase